MNPIIFIAHRLQKEQGNKKRMSKPAVRIATIGIGLGLALMLIAIAVVVGFQKEVRKQLIGFGSHITVSSYGNQLDSSIHTDTALLRKLQNIPHVKHIQNSAECDGIIKTKDNFYGVKLKGVDSTYQWNFFEQHLIEGSVLQWDTLHKSNKILISKTIAQQMQLKVGDKINTYFIQNKIRARRFKISGIYETSYKEFDQLFVLCDVRQVQKINHWAKDEYSNMEILIDDFKQIDQVGDAVFGATINRLSENGPRYRSTTIKESYPDLFVWLDMLDTNVIVILTLMCIVSGFIMVSGLLIIILEQTSLIGTLKALGASNWKIRRIFLLQASMLVGKGLLWGNIVGITLILIEHFFKVIPLNPEFYYVSFVPVYISLPLLLGVNLLAALSAISMMIAPSYIITKIDPAQAIRFE